MMCVRTTNGKICGHKKEAPLSKGFFTQSM
jgi:hypothetical protein